MEEFGTLFQQSIDLRYALFATRYSLVWAATA
jgi:hypothetical protein